jgi:16S rRNA (guanine527-N7)-methyltransferase
MKRRRKDVEASNDPAGVEEALRRVFGSAGGGAPPGCGRLARYVVELMRWNRRFHLTGMKTVEEIVEMGVFSSAKAAGYLRDGEEVVDVGSGNGLPGLVLSAMVPGARFTLVEKSRTRCSFLKTAAGEMGVENVEVRAGDAESLVGGPGFDAALSMAVFKPEQWLVLGRKLLARDGRVFLFHAGREPPPQEAEGLALSSNETFILPWSRHGRSIAVYREAPVSRKQVAVPK